MSGEKSIDLNSVKYGMLRAVELPYILVHNNSVAVYIQ